MRPLFFCLLVAVLATGCPAPAPTTPTPAATVVASAPPPLPPATEPADPLPEEPTAADVEQELNRWRTLEPGLELGIFESPTPSAIGDSRIHVVRVDPAHLKLALRMTSAEDLGENLTVKEWALREGLLAGINASMFQTDYRTSVELMVSGDHVNNARVGGNKAVLAFDPLPGAPEDLPSVRIIDRGCEELDTLRPLYGTLVQSIRMVSCKGANTWSQQPRIWSHACIGIDGKGRPLLIHARSPWSTHDFIDLLKLLPLDLRQLQYSEGGPEAQLYVNAGEVELERVGSYETGFWENDDNYYAWTVPNVIGVVRK